MEQRPKLINILIVLWILIGILFISEAMYVVENYLCSTVPDVFDMVVQYIDLFAINIAFTILLSIFSVVLAYGAFKKKSWTWLVGLMFAAYILILSIHESALSVSGLIFGILGDIAYSYTNLILPLCLTVLAALVIYLSMKPSVKAYFGKS